MLYVSSKVCYATMWREHRARGVPILSSWIDHDTVADWPALWATMVDEAARADALIAYAAEDERWNGTLVEIGAALSHGRPVYYIGPPFGPTGRETVLQHPLVLRAPTVERAIELATGRAHG